MLDRRIAIRSLLSFSVITVVLRNVRVSFWDDEEKRTGIYDLFMREDPSSEVRKRFPDGGWSLLPAVPSSHRISGLFSLAKPDPKREARGSGDKPIPTFVPQYVILYVRLHNA